MIDVEEEIEVQPPDEETSAGDEEVIAADGEETPTPITEDEETPAAADNNAEAPSAEDPLPAADELPPPTDELSEAQARIISLMELIESQSVTQLGVVKPEAAAPVAEPPEVVVPQTLADIVGDVDFNAMQDDPTKFIDMLSRVVDFTKEQTRNDVQSNLSNVVSQQTTQVVNMQQMVSDFYRDNSELSSVKQTVSVVAKNVGTEHPDWDMSKVLETAAEQTRTMLGIKPKPATDKKQLVRKGKKPAIPKQQKGKRVVAKKTTKQQQQINDLID